jgi:hypothetical protein
MSRQRERDEKYAGLLQSRIVKYVITHQVWDCIDRTNNLWWISGLPVPQNVNNKRSEKRLNSTELLVMIDRHRYTTSSPAVT